MGWKTPIRIELDESERAELETMARSHAVAHGVVVRAKIILGVAAGRSSVEGRARGGMRSANRAAVGGAILPETNRRAFR